MINFLRHFRRLTHMLSNSSIDANHSHEHQFPNEIIDEIIDHLQNNKKTLKAISLSSRIFLHRARKHLFATLVLQAKSVPSRKIFRLIESAPHLIPYIQVLEIIGSQIWFTFDRNFSKALGLFQQKLETDIATSSLRHIYLYDIFWRDLSNDVRAAIQRLLGFKSLNMVTFYSTSLPWTVFKEISPNVTALSLKNALFWPSCGPPMDSTQALLIKENGIDRLHIEALFIAYSPLNNVPMTILAHSSVFPLNVTHLRTFWVHVRCDDLWIRCQEFISRVSRSLETLGIQFSFFDDRLTFLDFKTLPSLPPLDCSQLDNLKHLHVQTCCQSVPLPLQSAFLWLCGSLETLPRQHQLQSITIRCVVGIEECIDYQSKRGSWPEVIKGLGWEHIDRFLTQPRFDSLSQIRVVLEQDPEVKGPKYSAVLGSAPVLLPRMMAKGVVVLDNYKAQSYRELM